MWHLPMRTKYSQMQGEDMKMEDLFYQSSQCLMNSKILTSIGTKICSQ